MEFPRNDLPEEIKHFFSKMKEYIEEEIYFYGSITRLDYFHGYSDIDVCIFSENMTPAVYAIVDPLPKPDTVTVYLSAPNEGSSNSEFNIEDEKYFVFRKLIMNKYVIIIFQNKIIKYIKILNQECKIL
jgi:predicted nucleotidyltransferase